MALVCLLADHMSSNAIRTKSFPTLLETWHYLRVLLASPAILAEQQCHSLDLSRLGVFLVGSPGIDGWMDGPWRLAPRGAQMLNEPLAEYARYCLFMLYSNTPY
jgi:hypothetical protein